MPFPAVIILTTVLTLTSIFGFYKIFLDKPPAQLSVNTAAQTSSEILQSLPSSPPAEANPSPTAKSNSPTPKPSIRPSGLIGSITVLQNNLNNQTAINGNSTISGLIDVSGTPQAGSSIVIVARKSGTQDSFKTVVDSVSPQDNASWTWTGAESGVSYDMLAVLKGKSGIVDVDYAQSQVYTIKSPAYQQIFSVNVSYLLAAPSGKITITCNTHNSDNTWTATVNFPQIDGALMYLLQIGRTSGGNDLADVAKNGQTQEITISDSVKYYARYAVATVSNPTAYQYSGFSSSTPLQCP